MGEVHAEVTNKVHFEHLAAKGRWGHTVCWVVLFVVVIDTLQITDYWSFCLTADKQPVTICRAQCRYFYCHGVDQFVMQLDNLVDNNTENAA